MEEQEVLDDNYSTSYFQSGTDILSYTRGIAVGVNHLNPRPPSTNVSLQVKRSAIRRLGDTSSCTRIL